MVQEKWVILNGVGISPVEILSRSLVDVGLKIIWRMYQYKWMIYQTTCNITIHTYYHMFVLMMLIWIHYANNYEKLGWTDPFPIWETQNTYHFIYNTYKQIWMRKNEFLRSWKILCSAFMCKRCLENIDTDITIFCSIFRSW